MTKQMRALTDRLVHALAPESKPYKKTDIRGGGLHIVVQPNGQKIWRFRVRMNGQDKVLTLGHFPKMLLGEAREKSKQMVSVVKHTGEDPIAVVRERDQSSRFDVIGREWLDRMESQWTKDHMQDVRTRMERHVFPMIGAKPIQLVQPEDVFGVVRAYEARSIHIARQLRKQIESVFGYALATGRHKGFNPATSIASAMTPLPKATPRASLLKVEQLRAMITEVEALPAFPQTKAAHRFLALTAMRIGEVRQAMWTQIEGLDTDAPMWVVPLEQMKMKRDHIVPLPRQAVDVIKAMIPVSGRQPYIFPNTVSAHGYLCGNAVGHMLDRAGYHGKMVPHGWRSAFSTIMNDRHPDGASDKIIEAALAHLPDDKIRAAYNRGTYLEHRRKMMQEWADLVMNGVGPLADVIEGPHRTGWKEFDGRRK
jgi:integrase